MAEPGSEEWRREQAAKLIAFGRGSELPDGGFGWLNEQGSIDRERRRPLFIAARMTYAYSLACLDTGDDDLRRLAMSGLTSLIERYADLEHGGWYASLDRDGQVDDSTKANYAHAHVLLASSTAAAARLPGAADLVAQATEIIERYFWRDDEGGAVENWDAAFTDLEDYRGANSNMHSIEAYLVAGDVTGNPVWYTRALAIASRLIDVHTRAHDWRLPEHYDGAWRPRPDYNRDHPDDQFRPFGWTPGHSFEWTRLLIALESALAEPPAWLLEAAVGMFARAVTAGWAPDGHPGFVYTLDFDDVPVVTQRLHWVICEAVLAADSLHRRTGEAQYARYAEQWWQHIAEHFVDPVDGSWWQELSATLEPSTTIWSGKPDVYHSYQALLLPSLPLAPCAAVTLSHRE